MFKSLYPAVCVHIKRRGLAAVDLDGDYEGLEEPVLVKLMKLLVHNLLSLAIAAVAMVILIRTSMALVPFLDRVAITYLKLITSSSFSPFMVMSVLLLVVLFTVIFDLSVLTSIPYVPALS
ncbi:hypothetical protein DPMN_064410 [Dreissena polymorpha]|uniref:Uncharacterized protein n=1 Tax=Dreissena polymorpha TaxID=45954 RepID=A0A9D4CC77_DREPO|nr:hypothetical protein DPMN_064410 [Dreissena polymorpha]